MPLAHRMGIWRIKFEMEDLAFRHLHPEEYYRLVAEIDRKRQEREADLQEAMNIIMERLAEMDMACDIQGRPKHLYSIWQKMQKQNKSLDEIYDLMAIRIIVDTVRDCYAVLGVIHALWKPIPGRFKDYIAVPKSNLYQSLHTTVVGPGASPMRSRSAPGRCTVSLKRAWPPTGCIKKGKPASPAMRPPKLAGCGRRWNGCGR